MSRVFAEELRVDEYHKFDHNVIIATVQTVNTGTNDPNTTAINGILTKGDYREDAFHFMHRMIRELEERYGKPPVELGKVEAIIRYTSAKADIIVFNHPIRDDKHRIRPIIAFRDLGVTADIIYNTFKAIGALDTKERVDRFKEIFQPDNIKYATGNPLTKLLHNSETISNMYKSIKQQGAKFTKYLTPSNVKKGLIGAGIIAAIGGAYLWYKNKDKNKEKSKEPTTYGILLDTKKALKSININNPKSKLPIDQVADICNGIGTLMYYTNSVLGIAEYYRCFDIWLFKDKLKHLSVMLDDNRDTEDILDAIVKTNTAFNAVHEEVIKILNEVQKEVLTEALPIIKKGSSRLGHKVATTPRIIISSLINGITGYVIYFDETRTLRTEPFMILEKSSIKVATILENATTKELLEVSDVMIDFYGEEDIDIRIVIGDVDKEYRSKYANDDKLHIMLIALMPMMDIKELLKINFEYIVNVLKTYVDSL